MLFYTKQGWGTGKPVHGRANVSEYRILPDQSFLEKLPLSANIIHNGYGTKDIKQKTVVRICLLLLAIPILRT